MKIDVVFSRATQRSKSGIFMAAEEDTEMSAGLIADSLKRLGHQAGLYPLAEESISNLKSLETGLIFNVIEWTGLDLPLAIRAIRLMEKSGIPFTGASAANYEFTTDKIMMKRMFDKYKLPTARWQVFHNDKVEVRRDFVYPVLVKLSREHSGIGLKPDSLVSGPDDLIKIVKARIKEFRQPVIAEEYIDGKEYEVGMLDMDDRLNVFPPAFNEYKPTSPVKFLTYDGRWQDDHEQFAAYDVSVAKFNAGQTEKFRRVCTDAFRKLKFRDYARFDIRTDKSGNPILLETNSNPGIDDHPDNGLAVGFHAAGMNFDGFIAGIVKSAARRFGLQT